MTFASLTFRSLSYSIQLKNKMHFLLVNALAKIVKPTLMIFERKNRDGFKVVGLSIRTTNKDGKAVDHINALWQMFSEQNILNDLPQRIDDTIYAVYSDYEGDHTKPYKFTIGCAVENFDNVSQGLDAFEIPAQSYAVSKAVGEPPKSVVESWTAIWESDLNRAYAFDFEVYGEKFFNPETREVAVYVSLEETV